MWRIFEFLGRFGNLLLFVFLEFVALFLVINLNEKHRSISQGMFLQISGTFQEASADIRSYFSLEESNDSLQAENRRLRKELEAMRIELNGYRFQSPFAPETFVLTDSMLPEQRFDFISARTINNTTHLNYNYLTLDKGARHGVEPGMGVIAGEGVVGMVIQTSRDYALAISALNRKSKISARLVQNGNVGSLVWDGADPAYGVLKYIPVTSPLQRGDTVITSGYGSSFAPGHRIGIVEDFSTQEQDGFYKIKVKMAANFRALDFVYLVKNEMKMQLDSLELEEEGE